MKITAISSTPRRHGNSDILIDRVVQTSRELGAEVEKIRIAGLDISPCTACDACQDAVETPCVIDDDAPPILEKFLTSDAIVFGGPIYNFAVAAQLKLLIDRMYSLGGAGHWDTLAGTRLGIVLTYGDEDRSSSGVENALGMFRDMASFIGVRIEGVVEASCSAAGEVLKNPAALASAEDLGRRLAGG